MFLKKSINRLTKFEKILWLTSVIVISISFFISNDLILTWFASIIGVTALIFVAKGDLLGQFLTIIFSVLYGIVSFRTAYYGEMITYLGMTAPMAFIALISWKNNPYKKGVNEVKVSRLTKSRIIKMLVFAVIITFLLYFVLKHFGNANLLISTFSITTSFIASYLTFCRSEYYAVAYALNDVVLIVLWILASIVDLSYLSMVACFVMFLANDLYGFFNWRKMKKKQLSGY